MLLAIKLEDLEEVLVDEGLECGADFRHWRLFDDKLLSQFNPKQEPTQITRL